MPVAPSGPSLFLYHTSRPGDSLPCFSIFALPRRTLKWASGGCCRFRPSFPSSSSLCPGALFFPCSTFKSWMRNELPAKHLLQPIPALPLAEKRKSRQATSSVARRWHVARAVLFLLQLDEKRSALPLEQGLSRWAGCARRPVRPIFIPLSHLLPRVFSSVLLPLCFAP